MNKLKEKIKHYGLLFGLKMWIMYLIELAKLKVWYISDKGKNK